MDVILNVDVKGTGKKGDVVTVSDGFGKNFLLKTGKAILADSKALNENAQAKKANAFHEEEKRKDAQTKCDKLDGKNVLIKVKAGDNGKIFGSVTTKEIAEQINKLGVEVDKKKIKLTTSIKQLGTYTVSLKLYKGIVAKIKVEVVTA